DRAGRSAPPGAWRPARLRSSRPGSQPLRCGLRRQPGVGAHMIDQHERAHAIAASRIQALIVDMVREVHGAEAIERRSRYDGDKYPERVPTPLAGVQAADWVVKRAGREIYE